MFDNLETKSKVSLLLVWCYRSGASISLSHDAHSSLMLVGFSRSGTSISLSHDAHSYV